jgi:hypothetical protein
MVIGRIFRQRAMVKPAVFRLPTGTRKSKDGGMELFRIGQEQLAELSLSQVLEIRPGLHKEQHPLVLDKITHPIALKFPGMAFLAGAVGGALFVFYLPGKCTRPIF